MFQDYALFPHRSVTQNVAFGLRMQGLAPAEIAQRTTEALEQVDLTGFADRRVTDLSGGEQQRVALARALAPRPRLLMLDEPLGALDKALKEELAEELRRLLHETGIPAIYVTHDQEEAFAIADRLILLHQGIVEQSGSPAEVHGAPASPWVARFLGLNNLIAGSVVSTRPLRAATPLGVFEGTWTGAGMAQPGMRIMLLLRPNGVRPSAGEVDPTAANRLSGMVTDSIFRGDGFRISVQAKDIELSFILPEGLSTGQPVTLAIAESAVQLMPYADGEPGQPGGNPGEPA
jgi:ABC-type Fe3+/spermidine/putrescine transport system ATPase subunit